MDANYYLTQIDKLLDDSQYDARMTVFFLEGVSKAAMADESMERKDRFRVIIQAKATRDAVLAANPQIGYYITKGGKYENI